MRGYILKDSYDVIKDISTLKKKIVALCEVGTHLVNTDSDKGKLRVYSGYIEDWCNDIQIYLFDTKMKDNNLYVYNEYMKCFNTLFNHSEDLMDNVILYG